MDFMQELCCVIKKVFFFNDYDLLIDVKHLLMSMQN